jgi:uncharacterized membrane protein YhaH (DUF805 family)
MTILDELGTRGRIDRLGFWLRHMLVLPVALALTIATQEVAVALEVAASAALTLFLVSTWARRLHDRGYSAWRLLAVLVPVAGALYLWIECALRKGDAQANPFGPAVGVRADYTTVGDAP